MCTGLHKDPEHKSELNVCFGHFLFTILKVKHVVWAKRKIPNLMTKFCLNIYSLPLKLNSENVNS